MSDGMELWAVVASSVLLLLYWAAPAVLWAVLFTRRRPVSAVSARPDQVLAHLAYRMRLAGFRVGEGPGVLNVRLGNSAAVKLFARPSPTGTDVSYQPSMTKSGLSSFLVFTVLFWTSAVAAGLILAVRRRVREVVRSQVAPVIPAGRPLPQVPAADDISVLLVNGLAEEHRMAAEAFEAQRSRYWDLHGYNVLAAFSLGLVVFFALFSGSTNPDFGARVQDSLVGGALAAVVFAIPVSTVIRAWIRQHLRRYRDAAERTRQALAREASHEEGPVSTFETLVDASREIPDWVEAVRRAGLSSDPVAGFVLLLVGIVASYAVLYAIEFALVATGFPVAAIAALAIGLVAGAVIAAGYVYYWRWKRRRDQELAHGVAEWTQRFEALRLRMERFLDGL